MVPQVQQIHQTAYKQNINYNLPSNFPSIVSPGFEMCAEQNQFNFNKEVCQTEDGLESYILGSHSDQVLVSSIRM